MVLDSIILKIDLCQKGDCLIVLVKQEMCSFLVDTVYIREYERYVKECGYDAGEDVEIL